MERLDLTKKNYEKYIPKEQSLKKKPVLYNVTLIIFVVVVICIFIYVFKSYTDKVAIKKFEEKVNLMINQVKSDVSDQTFAKEYLLVNFNNQKEGIRNDSTIVNNGKEIIDFSKGYIIAYKDNSMSFKLSDGKYCAYKSYNSKSYNISLFFNCYNTEVEYK